MRKPLSGLARSATGQGFAPWTRARGTLRVPMRGDLRSGPMEPIGPDQPPPRRLLRRTRRLTGCLSLRLTPEALERLQRDAEAYGYASASAFARRLLTERAVPPPLRYNVYRNLLEQTLRLGNNVNQLARAVNEGRATYLEPQAIQAALDLLREIRHFLLTP